MGKRNFKRKGSYAPKKARLLKVGELLAPLQHSDSPATGYSEIEFPTCGSDSERTSSFVHNHSNTSSIASSSSTIASKKSNNSEAEASYQDFLADGSYYVHIPETTSQNDTCDDTTEDDDDTLLELLEERHVDPALPKEKVVKEFLSGPNIQMAVQLLHLCNESQVALHYYDKFLELFQSYAELNLEDSWWKTIPSRRNLLKKLKSKLQTVDPVICTLSSTKDIVPRFSFLEQLKDLLSMPYFQDIESCCVIYWMSVGFRCIHIVFIF